MKYLQTEHTLPKAKGITLGLLAVIGLLLGMLIIFWIITDEIVLEKETGFDAFFFQKIAFLASGTTTRIMLLFTFFGSDVFLLPAWVLLTAYFIFLKKNTRVSLNIAAVGFSSTALLFAIKAIFKRQRPLDPLIKNVTGFSFPSGHSFSAFTFFGLIIYILWQTEMNKMLKYVLSITLFLLACTIAFSRVYLHVHYPSDVIAGFCLSILWLSISLFILGKINSTSDGLKQ